MSPPSSGASPLWIVLCLNDRGGAEISMVKLAQGLAEAGRHVTCVVYGAKPFLAEEFGFKGKIINLECQRTFTAFAKLSALLRKHTIGVLISALTHTNIAVSFANLFTGSNVHVFVVEHGIDGMVACQKSYFFRMLVRQAYRRVRAVVAVSRGLAQHIKDVLHNDNIQLQIIYNPLISDTKPPKSSRAHASLEQKKLPLILGVGRLTSEKNFELLLQAFGKFLRTTKARLAILGEGPERPRLEALVKSLKLEDTVILPGFIPDLDNWFSAADLLVLTSKREGFGNVIVEAMAHGVPIVATDCPYGPKEILENGLYGRLVPMDDVDALVFAIKLSLGECPDKEKLQKHAAKFSIQRSIDDYLALIDN